MLDLISIKYKGPCKGTCHTIYYYQMQCVSPIFVCFLDTWLPKGPIVEIQVFKKIQQCHAT